MGTPCASGVGTPKAGVGAVVAIGLAALQRLLESRGYPWLAGILTVLPIAGVEPASFCIDGQPAKPTITAADAQALLSLAPWDDFVAATAKVKDLVLHYLWFELCDCVTPPTPAPPAAQTPPSITGLPGGTGASCFITTSPCSRPTPTGCATALLRWNQGPGGSDNMYPNVAKSIRFVYKRTRVGSGSRSETITHTVQWGNSGFLTNLPALDKQYQSGDTFDLTVSVPPEATFFTVHSNASIDNTSDSHEAHAYVYCDQQPTAAPAAGCCPPDPTIVSLLTSVMTQVTLIQRQQVPFAYIRSTEHAGLSGHGHINVQGLIGCLVTLTTVPNALGLDVGDPDTLWSDSWINWGNADGSSERAFIRTSPQISLPAAAGQYTRIGYSLAPGVVATITELLREP